MSHRNSSIIDNPNRELSDDETIEQLMPLLDSGTQILAINQAKELVLLKDGEGTLEAFS